LADVWPSQIKGQSRIANPGCFPAATLTALAPLLADKLIEPGQIVVDAKTGISGAGRGGADSRFGYAESNENLVPYGLLKHVHMPEIATTIERLSGGSAAGLGPVFAGGTLHPDTPLRIAAHSARNGITCVEVQPGHAHVFLGLRDGTVDAYE